MKKAVVIGGSNGIGLAISCLLIKAEYFVEICDKCRPDSDALAPDRFHFNCCDLLDFDEELFKYLAADPDVEALIITAGVGRVADFEAHHIAEIDSFIKINTISTIKIVRVFYDRIKSNDAFYTAVMGSISGHVSTPAGSVYAASKAGVIRFIESVNIELEVSGTQNRILDISPGSFKGSRFYGGSNDLPVLLPLADEILSHLFAKDTLFIPQYKEIYSSVIERYNTDSHEFGIQSYEYKQKSGRMDNTKKVKIGYLSGTFDLFHIGHLNLLCRAKSQCDYLIVGVHADGNWKGKVTFIPLEDRKAIVGACKYVDKVVDACLEDSDAWDLYRYDKLFVGSDYKGTERFKRYEDYFMDKNVEIIYFPYTQRISSTQIRNAISSREAA